MMGKFTNAAKQAIYLAQEAAVELGHEYVGTEHLLLGLVRQSEGVAAKVLENEGVTVENILNKVKTNGERQPNVFIQIQDFTPRTKKVLEMSLREALKIRTGYIGTEHILLALIQESDCVAVKILISLNVNLQKVYDDMMNILTGEDPYEERSTDAQGRRAKGNTNTPTLDKFSRDLTVMAQEQKLDPVIGRSNEIERIIQILSRRTKNNPCLIGEPGVGKTAVVEALAQRIIQQNIPEMLKNKRVVTLDISSMVAGSKYRGEFENRIKKSLEEVRNAGNVVLFIDEIHTIIGAGAAEGAIDAANILKPLLARGEIQVIGATTLNEYRKHIEKDSALERRFQPVKVEEPSEEDAILILNGLRDKYEAHHEVHITDEAIVAAVKLSSRYITDRFLPDKAVDLIDEASSKVRLKLFTAPTNIKELEEKLKEYEKEKEYAIKTEQYEKASMIREKQTEIRQQLKKAKDSWKTGSTETDLVVKEENIAEVVSIWTGIPVQKIAQTEGEKLMNLEQILHKRVIGQEEAVRAVAKAIRRGRVGLKDPKRPIGSFLFLGPTGVGKTELSKALAEALFGDENSIVRVDMSEYMEKHSVSKMIGSPPGYVGFEEGGQMSEKIRRKPYSVILFDEVEKAHPDVFNVLLQVLDDGHITDSQGRKVDFKNTVIIMTSNLGARDIVSPKKLGFVSSENEQKDYTNMKKNVIDELKRNFKPEFLNRIDETIVFHQLSKEDIKEIVYLMFNQLSKRVKENANIILELEQQASELLVDVGFDPVYGARPLRRAIQSKIEDQLAEKILREEVREGDSVSIMAQDKELSFEVKPSKKPKRVKKVQIDNL